MSKEKGLFSKFELKGEFWKPNAADAKLQGTLAFSPQNGVRLELFGMFADESFKQGTIHGIVEGHACTLHKSYYFGSTRHFADGDQRFSRFSAIYLFIGANLEPENDPFISMEVRLTGLDEWRGHDAFKTNEHGLVGFVPCDCPSFFVESIDAEIALGYIQTFHDVSLSEVSWKVALHFDVDPKQPKLFEDYFWTQRRNLQQLLSLLVGKPVYSRSVILKLSKDVSVSVFSKDADNASEENEKRINLVEMIAPYMTIKDSWGDILKKWFTVSAQFEPSVMLFFRARFDPVNVQSDFLHLMQAIESFHREKNSGKPMSLRQRLNNIFSDLPPEILKLVKFEDTSTVIGQLVIDRNYLTHYSSDLKSKTSDTIALWAFGKGVEVILEYLLLLETGVAKKVILHRLPLWRQGLFNQRT